jgi:hypothetical protein
MSITELSEEDRRTLWEQFVEVYAKSQESYDSSVRTLAAAGVGVTASLATALHILGPQGTAAIALFLASLACNVTSHVTAQLDMRVRLACLGKGLDEGYDSNRWTTSTWLLNIFAGVALTAGGVLLAIYVSVHA